MANIKPYYELTKPPILRGNIIVFVSAFIFALQGPWGEINWLQAAIDFISSLVGMTLLMASGCVFNNYIDREIDIKMERTKMRPSATGEVKLINGIIFATVLLIIGLIVLYVLCSMKVLLFSIFAFIMYTVVYSMFSKKYTHHQTLIGAVPGAMPPVVAYIAASDTIDHNVYVLFTLMVLWQMVHSYCIAIYRKDEYIKSSVPLISIVKGNKYTVMWINIYMVLLLILTPLLGDSNGFTDIAWWVFTIIMSIFNIIWLLFILFARRSLEINKWAKITFLLSLIWIMLFSAVIIIL